MDAYRNPMCFSFLYTLNCSCINLKDTYRMRIDAYRISMCSSVLYSLNCAWVNWKKAYMISWTFVAIACFSRECDKLTVWYSFFRVYESLLWKVGTHLFFDPVKNIYFDSLSRGWVSTLRVSLTKTLVCVLCLWNVFGSILSRKRKYWIVHERYRKRLTGFRCVFPYIVWIVCERYRKRLTGFRCVFPYIVWIGHEGCWLTSIGSW